MPMVVSCYQWRPGSRYTGSAQEVGEELERIAGASGLQADPDTVVRAAEPDEAPLHPYFEWDRDKAAHEHRKDQARKLIRSIHVVEGPGPDKTPNLAFIHVRPAQSRPCYMTSARAIGDDELMKRSLADCMGLLKGISKRFGFLAKLRPDLARIFDAIDQFPD